MVDGNDILLLNLCANKFKKKCQLYRNYFQMFNVLTQNNFHILPVFQLCRIERQNLRNTVQWKDSSKCFFSSKELTRNYGETSRTVVRVL